MTLYFASKRDCDAVYWGLLKSNRPDIIVLWQELYMSTLTLLIFLLLALCFHSKVHFKSSVDLGSICSNDVKHLKFYISTGPKHFSLKTGFLLHLRLIHTFILYLLHFIFSFVDIYANMLWFRRVKPYLCYPSTLACYNNY